MSWLGLLLIGIALLDIIFSATRRGRFSEVLTATVVIGLALASGFTASQEILPVIGIVVVVVAYGESLTYAFATRQFALPLVLVAVALIVGFVLAGLAPQAGGPLEAVVGDSPFRSIADLSADRFLLATGVILMQLSTANVVVRLVLGLFDARRPTHFAGSGVPPILKGGSLLGPLERLFILGLGLAGQVTAAGILIAARGLPELQGTRGDPSKESDERAAAQYTLVGCFVSWAVALMGLAIATA